MDYAIIIFRADINWNSIICCDSASSFEVTEEFLFLVITRPPLNLHRTVNYNRFLN